MGSHQGSRSYKLHKIKNLYMAICFEMFIPIVNKTIILLSIKICTLSDIFKRLEYILEVCDSILFIPREFVK